MNTPCKCAPRRLSSSAFTLLELLVVVSIIAALIAILMPSLSQAVATSRRVVCASQARQIGQGLMLYSSDYHGQLMWYNSTSAVVWGGRAGTWGGYDAAIHAPSQRIINPYVGVPKDIPDDADVPLFECPADIGHGPTYANTDTVYKDVGNSYIYNRYAPNPRITDELKGITFSQIKRPDYLVLFGENTMHNFLNGTTRKQYWHDPDVPTSNITFADLHVSYHEVVSTNAGPDYGYLLD